MSVVEGGVAGRCCGVAAVWRWRGGGVTAAQGQLGDGMGAA